MMKPLTIAGLAGTLLVLPVQADEYAQQVAESRARTQEFMQALKAELQQGMQDGGAVNAIGVCNLKAPGIAAAISADAGWDIGRTSLRIRNPDNAPDAWELTVLEQFEQRRADGEDPAQMEYYAAAEQNGKTVFRYMKAIPTAALCVACHGADLAPAVEKKLAELYPGDQARGYQVGDIRGAFTIIRPLSPGGGETP
jgi:hypothetical protein